MNKLKFGTIIASAVAAATLGLAAPAQAGVDHQTWLDEINGSTNHTAKVPHVDTSVHQSR